ncbi:SDR family oxidoreductase [Microbacterium rhizomatis]|uniref:SDR family oxidoreductase n=1 Tax=Microbacterium rhizomatis TaxID=1631477 RepID=A0A5J5J650_9MICO|nr:SDR family oxidoreductase [Microbacterium rhizomatis]KAA9111532.1 SDR family oxidoreductase [Microbacterium rhizomatis]
MRIAVAGGTGTVGTHVGEAAHARGHEVITLARAAGVDLRSVSGLTDRLAGVDVVIDVLSVPTISADESTQFFTTTSRALLDAGAAAGVRHHLVLSIVGIDRAPEAYYAGKFAQERLVEAGPTPWTILRATQFHEFAAQMYGRAKVGPFHLAPKMRTRPVAASEVAAHLIDLAATGASGRARELAGPREEDLPRMIRAYARARGSRAWIPSVALPGASGRAQRDGSLLPAGKPLLGRQTFDEWLGALSAENH